MEIILFPMYASYCRPFPFQAASDVTCFNCNETMNFKSELKTHYRLSHPEILLFWCETYFMNFKSESELKSHNTKKHSILNSENESSKIETEKIYDESYNIECFWCTFRARSMEEMRKHKVENYIYEFHN